MNDKPTQPWQDFTIEAEGPFSKPIRIVAVILTLVVVLYCEIEFLPDWKDPISVGLAVLLLFVGAAGAIVFWKLRQECIVQLHGEGISYREGKSQIRFMKWTEIEDVKRKENRITLKGPNQNLLITIPFGADRIWNFLPEIIRRNMKSSPEIELPVELKARSKWSHRSSLLPLYGVCLGFAIVAAVLGCLSIRFFGMNAIALILYSVSLIYLLGLVAIMRDEKKASTKEWLVDQEGVEFKDKGMIQAKIAWKNLEALYWLPEKVILLEGDIQIILKKQQFQKDKWEDFQWWLEEWLYPEFRPFEQIISERKDSLTSLSNIFYPVYYSIFAFPAALVLVLLFVFPLIASASIIGYCGRLNMVALPLMLIVFSAGEAARFNKYRQGKEACLVREERQDVE